MERTTCIALVSVALKCRHSTLMISIKTIKRGCYPQVPAPMSQDAPLAKKVTLNHSTLDSNTTRSPWREPLTHRAPLITTKQRCLAGTCRCRIIAAPPGNPSRKPKTASRRPAKSSWTQARAPTVPKQTSRRRRSAGRIREQPLAGMCLVCWILNIISRRRSRCRDREHMLVFLISGRN